MRRTGLLAAAALATLVQQPAQAQAVQVITAIEAKQCAVWAGFLADRSADNAEAMAAFLYAANYFVGYYEGLTGRSIDEDEDREALLAVDGEIDRLNRFCGNLMVGYGTRMTEWSQTLTRIGGGGK